MADDRRKKRWRTIRRWIGNGLFFLAALALGVVVYVRLFDRPTQPTMGDGLPAGSGLAQVTNVIDGDTIDVRFNDRLYRVRYIGIDTPEAGEDLWDLATARNRALVTGQTVQLAIDVSETDRYGRLLRYVYLPNGSLVNEMLVREGLARVTSYPPDTAQEKRLQTAEAWAQERKLGIWAESQ